MDRVRIGVLGPADIAMRRMVPAIKKSEKLIYVGVAVATPEEREAQEREEFHREHAEVDHCEAYKIGLKKADRFISEFGGKVFPNFRTMLESEEIDAVYIALPPALHFRWAKKALENGKHVLLEKPFTTDEADAKALIELAKSCDLAVSENFGFIYHNQIRKVCEIMRSGRLGEIRLIRSNFAFPFRGGEDFRYHKALGGGALLDCGCYTLRLADFILEGSMELLQHILISKGNIDVDLYGSATALGSHGELVELSFGMDQQYNCELEVWGSLGCITSPRIYTAPPSMGVELTLKAGNEQTVILTEPEDQFLSCAEAFADMLDDFCLRSDSYEAVLRQSSLVEECMSGGVVCYE